LGASAITIVYDGAMLILEASPGEFYIAGSGLTVNFARDLDVDAGVARIESAEQAWRALVASSSVSGLAARSRLVTLR
jgi:hypothetical protein